MVVLSIFSGIFFYGNNTSFFFHWHLFFYFISNNNFRLLTINIVSFIFFYYRKSKPPFCLHYEKSNPVNIVSRKINWKKPTSMSAYTQSEYRISNYVNHIRIIANKNSQIVTTLKFDTMDESAIFVELCMKWSLLPTLKGNYSYKKIWLNKNFYN